MKKGQRPAKHTRIVKTKKGPKKVVVNKSIKRKVKTKGVISVDERKIFNLISNTNEFDHEMGGYIDFYKNGRMEEMSVFPGKPDSVDVPDDYEVQYHTHPSKHVSPPSPEDLFSIIRNDRQQAEIVFQDGSAFVIVPTVESKKLRKLSDKEIYSLMENVYDSTVGPNWEKDFKKELEKLGFFVYINNEVNKPLVIDVVPVEPRKKRSVKKWA